MPKYASKYVGAGDAPSGWVKVGNIAVNESGTSSNPSDFVGGILDSYDENGWVVISDTTTAGLVGRPTGGGTGTASTNTPTFWVSGSKTDESFLNLAKRLTGSQSLVNASSGKTLLNNSGFWTSWVAPPSIVSDGLILNLDAGNTTSYSGTGITWLDLSGNNYDGSLQNGVTYSQLNGGVFIFDGVNDYISITGSITLNSATFITWVKRNGNQTRGAGMIFSRSPGFTSGLNFNYASDNRIGYHWNDQNWNWDSNLIIPDLTWCMCVISITPTNATAYLCQSTGITSSILTTTHNSTTLNRIRVGADSDMSRYTNGQISVAQIYNRALSESEITQNFNALKSRYGL